MLAVAQLVCHSRQTLEFTIWSKPDSCSFSANTFRNCLYDLQCEPGSVLDRTAVLVRTMIRQFRNELVDEVTICPIAVLL